MKGKQTPRTPSAFPSRYRAEIEAHIHRAKSGKEPHEAAALLAFFCEAVGKRESPPVALLNYLADAFSQALKAARDVPPQNIDCRKPLGLVRGKRGAPSGRYHSPDGRHEIGAAFANEVAAGLTDGEARSAVAEKLAVSETTARACYDERRAADALELGRNLWNAIHDELATLAQTDSAMAAQARQNAFIRFSKHTGLSESRLAQALQAYLQAVSPSPAAEI